MTRFNPDSAMPIFRLIITLRLVIASAALLCSGQSVAYDWTDGFNVGAREGDRYNLIVSPYAQHFRPSPEHDYVWLVGAERERSDGSLAGAAYFSNSFGQPSAYIYPWGKTFRNLVDDAPVYVKLTAGLLYGYKDPYENKIPFNLNGFAFAIVPALGWEFSGRQQVQLNFLGLNGVMLQFSLPVR